MNNMQSYLEGLNNLKEAINEKLANKTIWTIAEGSMTLSNHVKGNDMSSLESLLKLEIEFGRWLSGLSDGDLARVTGAVELFAAQLESGDTVDDVSDDVIGAIGEERVREGEVFVEWFEEHVGGFLLESGHFVLAKSLGRKCVYHAGKSGSTAVQGLVWEKVGRRWEWMSSHPGGFVAAGRELVALGREKVGRVLMQYGHLESNAVALSLALHDELGMMEGDLRDTLGIEPHGGGFFEFDGNAGGPETSYGAWLSDGRLFTLSDRGRGAVWRFQPNLYGKIVASMDFRVESCERAERLAVFGDRSFAFYSPTSQSIHVYTPDWICGHIPTESELSEQGLFWLSPVDDGKYLVAGLSGRLMVWDLETMRLARSVQLPNIMALHVVLEGNGIPKHQIAICGILGHLMYVNVQTGVVERELEVEANFNSLVSIRADEVLLTNNRGLHVLSLGDGKERPVHASTSRLFILVDDDKALVGVEDRVELWDWVKGELLFIFGGVASSTVAKCSWDPRARRLAIFCRGVPSWNWLLYELDTV